MLGEGEVFQVWSGGDDQDLSGTEISASQPVAVFSGNITTTYGRTGIDVQSPDMVHEQMPPTAHWSLKYVAAALPPQAKTCDTLLGQRGHVAVADPGGDTTTPRSSSSAPIPAGPFMPTRR